MFRHILLLLVVLALIGGGLLLYSPEGRHLLDRASINLTRAANQWHYQRGEPLTGTPDLANFDARLDAQGLKLGAPVFVRIFKLESELELWMKKDDERYELFAPTRSAYGPGVSDPS